MLNAQFSSDKTAPTRAAASPRMRIENWELCIGQIFPERAFCQVIFEQALGCARSLCLRVLASSLPAGTEDSGYLALPLNPGEIIGMAMISACKASLGP